MDRTSSVTPAVRAASSAAGCTIRLPARDNSVARSKEISSSGSARGIEFGIGRKIAGNVLDELTRPCAEAGGEENGGQIRAAPFERSDRIPLPAREETWNHDDVGAGERRTKAERPQSQSIGAWPLLVVDQSGLVHVQSGSLYTSGVQCEHHECHGSRLASRPQQIERFGVRVGDEILCAGEERICQAILRRDNDDELMVRLARQQVGDERGHPAERLRVGEDGSAKLDDRD